MLFPRIPRSGAMSFAPHPPHEGFLVTQLWDRFMSPIWREPREAKPARDPELERKLVREMRDLGDSETSAEHVELDEADFIVL